MEKMLWAFVILRTKKKNFFFFILTHGLCINPHMNIIIYCPRSLQFNIEFASLKVTQQKINRKGHC